MRILGAGSGRYKLTTVSLFVMLKLNFIVPAGRFCLHDLALLRRSSVADSEFLSTLFSLMSMVTIHHHFHVCALLVLSRLLMVMQTPQNEYSFFFVYNSPYYP